MVKPRSSAHVPIFDTCSIRLEKRSVLGYVETKKLNRIGDIQEP